MTAYWTPRGEHYTQETLLEKVRSIAVSQPNLYIRASDGRIAHGTEVQQPDTPWLFSGTCPFRHCGIWNGIYFKHFGLIPTFCRFTCWKVVVRPQTVVDLFKLFDLQQEQRMNCKCGLDLRQYTAQPYGGFYYTESLQQGRRIYNTVKQDLINKFGKKHPPCFLKRGCTEMEQQLPSDQWDLEIREEDLILERMLDDIFVKTEATGHQSQWIVDLRKAQWIRHAIGIGDPTWRQLVDNSNNHYTPHTVQYEDDDIFYKTMSPGGSEKALENL